jgi:spore coat protein U-like protein
VKLKKRLTQAQARSLPLLARLGVLAGVLCTAYVGNAYAATATGVMTVTATVASTCIVSTSTLAFGSSSSAAIQAGNVDATGSVSVNCTTGSAYTIALDKGAGVGATLPIRKMTSGANTLNYTVYTDATRATIWGDGTASSTVPGTGTGAAQLISAYGRIFSAQTVPAAAYTDTINVTVSY